MRTAIAILAQVRVIAIVALTICAAAVAPAHPGHDHAKRPPAPEPAPADALRGPAVTDNPLPQTPAVYTDPTDPLSDGGPRDAGVPHDIFMRLVHDLKASDAKPELLLTSAQLEKIDVLDKEYRAEVQKFRRDHANEFKRAMGILRDAAAAKSADGEIPAEPKKKSRIRLQGAPVEEPPPPPPTTEEIAEARRMLDDLQRQVPRPLKCHTLIWEVLTPPQRDEVRARVNAWRADRIETRLMKAAEREARGDNDDDMAPAPEKVSPRPEAQIPPPARRRPASRSKPAPDMDDVNVPPADDAENDKKPN